MRAGRREAILCYSTWFSNPQPSSPLRCGRGRTQGGRLLGGRLCVSRRQWRDHPSVLNGNCCDSNVGTVHTFPGRNVGSLWPVLHPGVQRKTQHAFYLQPSQPPVKERNNGFCSLNTKTCSETPEFAHIQRRVLPVWRVTPKP